MKILKLVFVILAVLPLTAASQPQKSLDECIETAWERNPGLRNDIINMKEARLNYVSSVGSFLPEADISVDIGRSFGRSIDPETNGYTNNTFDEGSIGLNMTLSLFEGFSRINRVRFERANRNRSEWELKDRQNNLAYQVTDVYYKLLLEERMLELAREQSRLSERYLKQTEAFVGLGLKSASDLQEVRARREGDIYRCQARENSYRLTLLRLKQLMNMQEAETLAVQDTILYEVLPEYTLPNTDNLYSQSLAVMPSLQMIKQRQKAAQREYAMAGGNFSPSIYARFSMSSYYINEFSVKKLDNNLGKYIGIGVSFPLLNGLERLTTIRKHKLNMYRIGNEAELERQQLYTDVAGTVLSLNAGSTEFKQTLLQMNAEKSVLKESERKWEEGLISVFQLMEARNRFISAKAELIRVRLQVEMMMVMEKYYRTGSFRNIRKEA